MKLSLFIAWRYVFSKKKKTFINFLSYFSIASISIGTAAMIIVLSVFNGLENTLMSIYKGFDPNIKIEHKENKYFNNEKLKLLGKELIIATDETIEDSEKYRLNLEKRQYAEIKVLRKLK